MKTSRKLVPLAVLLLVAAFSGSVIALRGAEAARGSRATIEDVLYLPSPQAVKRLSLGYSGLLADIYWTRAVQYFGQKHLADEMNYNLLYPLLDITTDLDPHLLISYEFGSIFLSQPPPAGAGQPDKAVALLEKGIRANPDEWKLYFSLGFVNYMDRKDYKAAFLAFQRGSQTSHAHPWLKVMAATMAQRANETAMAFEIWKFLDDTTQDKLIKENAEQHMTAIVVDRTIMELERRITIYTQRTGHPPASWFDLGRESLLSGVPLDPTEKPYKLMPGGTVEVADPNSLPFITKGLPPGWRKSTKPRPSESNEQN